MLIKLDTQMGIILQVLPDKAVVAEAEAEVVRGD